MMTFGMLLIIGILICRDELLHELQRKEYEKLLDAWDHAHGELPPPAALPVSAEKELAPARALLRSGAPCRPAPKPEKAPALSPAEKALQIRAERAILEGEVL